MFSYRLSIMHFWSLVFVYIWAGPHHLHYSAVPEWASTLGMLFSLILWMPSWGGMVNGFFTLRGAWHKLREDPILKFMVVAVTYYGMSTFEGPMMSIKSVNAVSHFTDWTIGHVHAGALGWNAFLSFGILYWVVPRLWKTELYSKKLATTHFWVATVGLILYQVSMWVAGITQWAMWRAFEPDGRLVYPDFIETVIRIVPALLGPPRRGAPLLLGPDPARLEHHQDDQERAGRLRRGARGERAAAREGPVGAGRGDAGQHLRPRASTGSSTRCATASTGSSRGASSLFTVLVALALAVGSLVEAIPMFFDKENVKEIASVTPVHAARGRRPRHLHPRGLLQLPLAAGPAVPVRDRALRRVLEGRRVRLRPPVPVGLEADRARPAPRRREVPVALARAPHAAARLDDAGVDHAALPAPADRRTTTPASSARRCARCAPSACPTRTARSRRPPAAMAAQAKAIAAEVEAQKGPTGLARQGDRRR